MRVLSVGIDLQRSAYMASCKYAGRLASRRLGTAGFGQTGVGRVNEPIDWLLEGPPWVQYRTLLDLLKQPEDCPEVLAARQALMASQQIQLLLVELAKWPDVALKRHNDASHLLHKLTFIADLGLRISDQGVSEIVEGILCHRSQEGVFQVLVNIPPRYGGTGENQWSWMLCDSPLMLYALARLGLKDDQRVRDVANHLMGLIRENGWPCAVAPELGRFRGPGRKADPCPYAILVMLRALSQVPEWRDSEASRTGAETLLGLWEQRKERRPYLFAMGTDFGKLKVPLIWYDILHVTDVLSNLPWLREDGRLKEMVDKVRAKADGEGRFTPESVWRAWAGWDFGQKRVPSRWLTLVAHRMLKRADA